MKRKSGPDQVLPRERDRRHRAEGDEHARPTRERIDVGVAVTGDRRRRICRREQRQQRQHGDHGDVLEEQHRERALTRDGLELALFAERLQHDRRRGEREDRADRERGAQIDTEKCRGAPQHQRGRNDLEPAETEQRTAHPPQHRRLQLEPDHEEHHHDAELGEVQDVLAFAAHETEREGTDRDARDQVAEHRAQAESTRDRNRDHGSGQVDEGLIEKIVPAHPVGIRRDNESLPWRSRGRARRGE